MNPANPTATTPAATRTPFFPAPLEAFGPGGFGGVVGETVALAELLGMPLVAIVATTLDVEVEFAELVTTLLVPVLPTM